jgi:hypothetical protein
MTKRKHGKKISRALRVSFFGDLLTAFQTASTKRPLTGIVKGGLP